MKEKKSLGGVRPDDYLLEKFKDIAKEKDISQSEMFNRIFYYYLNGDREKKQEQALNLDSEINLISKDMENMLSHFKNMASKAQDTLISLRSNTEQTEKNLLLDIDTAAKKEEEYKKRNDELELFNSTFSKIKDDLSEQVALLTQKNGKMNETLEHQKNEIEEKSKKIKSLEDSIERMDKITEKESNNLKATIKEIQEEAQVKDTKIRNFETTISSLNDTINNISVLKKAEIESVNSKYEAQIAELNSSINLLKNNRDNEMIALRKNLEVEFNADKKEAVADIRIKLAEMKEKYAESITEAKKR